MFSVGFYMHEFSLCQSISRIIDEAISERNVQVRKVVLAIGDIAGVDIDSLLFWFPVACKDKPYANTIVEVVPVVAEMKCLSCDQISTIKTLYDACPHCQSFEREITSGREMYVKNIEVE